MPRRTPTALALLLAGSAILFAQILPAQAEPVPSAFPDYPPAPGAATPDADLARLRQDMQARIDAMSDNETGTVYSGAVPGTDPNDMVIAVALTDGRTVAVGDTDTRFPLMSVSKPFTYALALEQHGADFMLERIGMDATGFPYNAVAAGAVRGDTEQNPLVNAGAIATHSFIRGAGPEEKIGAVVALYSGMANADLAIDEDWRATPRALTYTLAYQMQTAGRLEGDVDDVTERYLEACIVGVDIAELAQMGATLANDGVQPVTGERLLTRETVRTVLAAMTIAGMYEDSGAWFTRVGLPAKSGVSGAILAVAPGWGAIVAYSPRLDAAGNSVRAAIAIERLSRQWGLNSIDRLLDAAPGR